MDLTPHQLAILEEQLRQQEQIARNTMPLQEFLGLLQGGKMRTKGISPDLLKPVLAALTLGLTGLIVTGEWTTLTTAAVVSAGLTALGGYFLVGPGWATKLFKRIHLSNKLLAGVFAAAATAVGTAIATGAWEKVSTLTLVAAALAALAGMITASDPTE